jgi:hypothetical protein
LEPPEIALMMLTIPIIPGSLESGASCFGEVVVVVGHKTFDGGWVGSATKAQTPKVVARAWVGVAAIAALRECIPVLVGTPARAPKAGKTGGDMVAVEL